MFIPKQLSIGLLVVLGCYTELVNAQQKIDCEMGQVAISCPSDRSPCNSGASVRYNKKPFEHEFSEKQVFLTIIGTFKYDSRASMLVSMPPVRFQMTPTDMTVFGFTLTTNSTTIPNAGVVIVQWRKAC